MQLAAMMHRLLDAHMKPSGTGGFEQVPFDGSQKPGMWQGSGGGGQMVPKPPWHTPAWQVSPLTHALPVPQLVPSDAFGFEHTPVAGLHTPAVWQVSSAVQVMVEPPWHAPDWQVVPV